MKKHLQLAAIILLAFSLTGCAESSAPTEETPSQTQALLPESDAPLLKEGETVTISGECQFHVDYVAISEHPELYYEADAGKTYAEFCITFQNLADYTVNASNVMRGKLIYSGMYEYGGNDTVTDEDGLFSSPAHWFDMEPSDSMQIHYFFLVPKEVQDSSRTVELNMNICENEYRVIVREGEKGVVPASGSASISDKTSGEIGSEDVVVTDNAEFYVEHAVFTKKATPLSPGTAYNYYEAENGKIFLDFCVAYTNRASQKMEAGKAVSADLDQAEAAVSVTELSNRSAFEDYSNVAVVLPLCTEYIHCIFQVPEELETNSEPVTVSFKIDGNRYTYSVK